MPITKEQKRYVSRQLIRIGQLLEISELLVSLLKAEKFISGDAKSVLGNILTNIEQAKRRFPALLTTQSQMLARQDVLSEAKVLHICAVIDCMAQMPDETCDALADGVLAEYERYQKEQAEEAAAL